ncbi:MAG: hypothetical protein KIT31_43480, partial [Deltaproteobacteria bacterium]|nr:hypothetical protein [Deltaproteobacteria bacterium]
PAALAAIGAALPASQAARSVPRFEALAGGAPDPIFVSPVFDTERFALPRTDDAGNVVMPRPATPGVPAAMPTLITPAMPERATLRVDDNDATPDDVFTAIASGVARERTIAAAPTARPPVVETYRDRETAADAIARTAPVAPGAGLSPGLASSPFAPALRHVLPLPAAPTFDVRALFGDRLSATYLAGLLAPEAHEVAAAPGASAWTPAMLRGLDLDVPAFGAEAPVAAEREVPSWDPSYVAPELPELASPGVEASFGGEAVAPSAAIAAPQAQAQQLTAAITTLRSALLSWDVVVPEAPVAMPSAQAGAMPAADEPAMFAPAAFAPLIARALGGEAGGDAGGAEAARQMLEGMSLPMLGDVSPVGDQASVWTAPGMVANRAYSWSVAQERSSTDLALDFVTPELVLAARVYGLGPAEAAQAARLAIAGPGQLSAMASTVDRTFVQAMAIEADRRERAMRGEDVSALVPSDAAGAPARVATAYPTTADASRGAVIAAPATSSSSSSSPSAPVPSAFGVDRRTPRGAFLWPSATVAALRLDAPAPDGDHSMSVAALELLAAQTVAEIGTYAAFGDRVAADEATTGETASSSSASSSSAGVPSSTSMTTRAPELAALASAPLLPASADAGEHDVLAAAATMVPAARRARFEALYVALGQAGATRSWSPAARAARA